MTKADINQAQVALITGATGSIGAAIAKGIAKQKNYEVILIAQDKVKLIKTIEDIKQATGNQKVRYESVNLSRKADIFALAQGWSQQVHVLVNNAAVTPRQRVETPEGIEYQFATNVLGYFWMIQAFWLNMKQAEKARIVNVASYWAGNLDLDDLEFRQRSYDNNTAYRQSKQANRMLTVAFAERLKPFGIAVNSCHPGDVNSKLSNNLGFGGHETPDQGARTPVWLATTDDGYQKTGKYFEQMREVHCRFSENRMQIEALYAFCEEY